METKPKKTLTKDPVIATEKPNYCEWMQGIAKELGNYIIEWPTETKIIKSCKQH